MNVPCYYHSDVVCVTCVLAYNYIKKVCKCKFDSNKCNSNQKCAKDKSHCDFKNLIKYRVYEKGYSLYLSKCACEISKYLKNYTYMKIFMDGSVVTYDEIIYTPEILSINSKNKKAIYKMDYYI